MGELPADARLGAIRLRVGDVERLTRFYEQAIGLQVVEDGPVTALGVDGQALVELEAAPDAPPRPLHTTGLFHLAILVPSRADLALALRRVAAAGWRLSGASDHLVSEALYLSDPEGNGIELYRDRPRDEWPAVGGVLQMDTLPLDLGNLLSEVDEANGDAGMPAGTTLGHVHLQVSDLTAAERFWADALGFDVTVRGYPGALFVSAGGYHHHVGLNTWAGAGAPPPPDGALGLDRFEVVLPDADAVSEAGGRLAAAGPVELVEDGVLAADPSGNARARALRLTARRCPKGAGQSVRQAACRYGKTSWMMRRRPGKPMEMRSDLPSQVTSVRTTINATTESVRRRRGIADETYSSDARSVRGLRAAGLTWGSAFGCGTVCYENEEGRGSGPSP